MAEFSFNLKDITKLFTASGPALPESDAEMILEADGAYAEAVASSSGSDHDAHDAARFRLAWALAHSKRAGDAARAVILLQEGSHRWGETVLARDRHYIVAVAHFNDGDYLAARTAADEALREDAACRQAETLKAAVPCVAAEDKIAKDGLIGLGAVGVGAAVLGGVLSALAASGRRR